MDLILLDENFKKIKPVVNFKNFYASTGLSGYASNTFELVMPYKSKNDLFEKGQYLIWGTSEFGGKILRRTIDTEKKLVTYGGFSFRGFFNNNYIGSGILTIAGNANVHIEKFAFWTMPEDAPIKVSGGTDTEDITIEYPALSTRLYGMDLAAENFSSVYDISIINGNMVFYIKPKTTHYFDNSQAKVVIDEDTSRPNLVYAVNLDSNIGKSAYLQPDGTIGEEKYFLGFDTIEKTITSSSETVEELYAEAAEALANEQKFTASEVSVNIPQAEIGDTVVISVAEFGVKITKKIVEKTITKTRNEEKIIYTMEG